MSTLASPLQMAALAAVVAWPLAAGLGIVVWSKFRAGAHARRVSVLTSEVRGFYRAVELQPTPDRLKLVVDALEESDAMAAAIARNGLRQRVGAGA